LKIGVSGARKGDRPPSLQRTKLPQGSEEDLRRNETTIQVEKAHILTSKKNGLRGRDPTGGASSQKRQLRKGGAAGESSIKKGDLMFGLIQRGGIAKGE